MPPEQARGYTVADVATRYRVSPDKVRLWIRRGQLAAINTASSLCGRPQLRITAECWPRSSGGGRSGRRPNRRDGGRRRKIFTRINRVGFAQGGPRKRNGRPYR